MTKKITFLITLILSLLIVGCDSGNDKRFFATTDSGGAPGTGPGMTLTTQNIVDAGTAHSFTILLSNVLGTGTLSGTLAVQEGTVDTTGVGFTFGTLTEVVSGEFQATVTIDPIIGDGRVLVTIIYDEAGAEIAKQFNLTVRDVITSLVFDVSNPSVIDTGATLTVTATGTPAGGQIELAGGNEGGTTGGTFVILDPVAGTFEFSGSTASGTAFNDITYRLPGGDFMRVTFTVVVDPSVGTPNPTSLLSTDTPSAFDESASFVSSIAIASPGTSITNLRVRVHVTHDRIGSVRLVLTSPAGTVVELKGTAGASGNNLGIIFDESSALSLTGFMGNTPPPFMTFRTISNTKLLDNYLGEDPNGTWTLEVFDLDPAAGNGGMLEEWGIALDGDTSIF